MIRWILERLERDPHAVFYEKEIRERFRGEFDEAVERRLLRRVPVGETYGYGLARPRTLVALDGGGYEAVDDEDLEAEPIKLTALDVVRWRLDMDQIGRLFQEENGLKGEPGTLSPRLHFLGESGGVGVVLGLLQKDQASSDLAALPALLPGEIKAAIVVSPTYVPPLEMAKSSVLANVTFASLGYPDPLNLDLTRSTEENVFRKEGDYWVISFEGRSFTIRHMRGLEHIARLVTYPGREVAALKLAGSLAEAAGSSQELGQEGLRSGGFGDLGAQMDAKAKADYQRRISVLEAKLESGILDKTERADITKEKASLERELSRAFGAGGRTRPVGSASERARGSVTKAVDRAIAAIEVQSPTLARFLRNSIKTGYFCTYAPDRPIRWTAT